MRKIHRLSGLFAAVVLIISTSIVGAAPAQAAERIGHFQNVQTGACLDSNQAGAVYTLPCQPGNNYQTWKVQGLGTKASDGYFQVRLVNVATGRCLEMYLSPGDNNSMHVETELCANAIADQIDGHGPSWSNVQLRAWHYSTYGQQLCIDTVAVGMAYANRCNYGNYQTWRLI